MVYDPCPREFQATPKAFDAENPVILQVGTGANKNLLRVAESLRGISCRLRIIGKLSDEQIRVLRECRINYSAVAGVSSDGMVKNTVSATWWCLFPRTKALVCRLSRPKLRAPVVTSNILSMPEVAGEGPFANPFDATSIRQAILRVVEDGPFRDVLVRLGFANVDVSSRSRSRTTM